MNTIRRLGTILVVAVALTGCQKEILTPDNGTKDLGREIELTMSASMSDVVIPTRALTEAEEKAITRLDVLVFNENDTFAYTVQANTPTVTVDKLSYTVRLKKNTTGEKSQLVLLANLANAPTISGTTKEEVLAAITFTPVTDWTTGTTIPMWADYPTPVEVTTSTTATEFGETALIRSLARVNVTNAASTFTLTKVWVYNSTNKARVAPASGNYDAPNKKVNAPSIATNAGTIGEYSKDATNTKVEREIYIGESAKQAVGDASAVCLVLEGDYGGATNFYRVDMVGGTDGKTPLDILRNHTYNVNITRVAGSGYGTKKDAFASMPVNITVEMKVWDDANLNDIIDDGQYYLAVDKASVKVDAFVNGIESIAYNTNHPKGATVDVSCDWITQTSSGNTSPITFSYTENTSTTNSRNGSITITAGRIKKQITISQTARPVYVGMFGGELVGDDTNGWAFSKKLYVQTTDESSYSQWATNTNDHSALAGSKTDGKANTWNLNKGAGGNLTGFPAANLCFKKNNTFEQASENALLWYLPALDQFMGIWVTYKGSNASFYGQRYWSSSESNSYSWIVGFNTGDTHNNDLKTKGLQVRCVREL